MLKTIANPKRGGYRVAVVVSRKVHKSAVARNRIRRRLYGAIRLQEANIVQPHDIVINVFDAKITEESPKELARLVKKQLAAAGVLGKTGNPPIHE